MDKRSGKKPKQIKQPKVEDSTALSDKPPLNSSNQKKSPKKK